MSKKKVKDVFEVNVPVHPNMNMLLMKEFNSSRIQQLLKMGSFFGEVMKEDEHRTRSFVDMNIIRPKTSVIQILSLKEDMETLKITFRFLDTELAQEVKQSYIRSPQSFKIRPRAFGGHNESVLFLATFDIITDSVLGDITPPTNKKAFSLRALGAIGVDPPTNPAELKIHTYDHVMKEMRKEK